MEKKIIEITKCNDGNKCLLCCDKYATVKIKINRLKYNDSVIGFDMCDVCFSRMQQDIQKICE